VFAPQPLAVRAGEAHGPDFEESENAENQVCDVLGGRPGGRLPDHGLHVGPVVHQQWLAARDPPVAERGALGLRCPCGILGDGRPFALSVVAGQQPGELRAGGWTCEWAAANRLP